MADAISTQQNNPQQSGDRKKWSTPEVHVISKDIVQKEPGPVNEDPAPFYGIGHVYSGS